MPPFSDPWIITWTNTRDLANSSDWMEDYVCSMKRMTTKTRDYSCGQEEWEFNYKYSRWWWTEIYARSIKCQVLLFGGCWSLRVAWGCDAAAAAVWLLLWVFQSGSEAPCTPPPTHTCCWWWMDEAHIGMDTGNPLDVKCNFLHWYSELLRCSSTL